MEKGEVWRNKRYKKRRGMEENGIEEGEVWRKERY